MSIKEIDYMHTLHSNYVHNPDHEEFQYLWLLYDVLDKGEIKPIFDSVTKKEMPDRYLKSLFGRQLRFDLSKGFPLLTTKKVFYRGAVEEMLWFIKDGGNVTKLIQKGVNIWNEWAWKLIQTNREFYTNLTGEEFTSQDELVSYLKETGFALHLPLHYTNFTGYKVRKEDWSEPQDFVYLDQMQWIIDNLPKRPERKSYYATCWNPAQAYQMSELSGQESAVIVACHIDHLVNIQGGKLNLRVGIRSSDTFLGLPFNIAQYAVLAHMYSFLTGFPIGELVVNIDDYHLYSNQFELAKEQILRDPYPFPQLQIRDRGQKKMQDFVFEDFELIDYQSHPALKGEITVVGGY